MARNHTPAAWPANPEQDDAPVAVSAAPPAVGWEYRSEWMRLQGGAIQGDRNYEAAMNVLGAEGWELVTAVASTGGMRCLYKRPAAPARTAEDATIAA